MTPIVTKKHLNQGGFLIGHVVRKRFLEQPRQWLARHTGLGAIEALTEVRLSPEELGGHLFVLGGMWAGRTEAMRALAEEAIEQHLGLVIWSMRESPASRLSLLATAERSGRLDAVEAWALDATEDPQALTDAFEQALLHQRIVLIDCTLDDLADGEAVAQIVMGALTDAVRRLPPAHQPTTLVALDHYLSYWSPEDHVGFCQLAQRSGVALLMGVNGIVERLDKDQELLSTVATAKAGVQRILLMNNLDREATVAFCQGRDGSESEAADPATFTAQVCDQMAGRALCLTPQDTLEVRMLYREATEPSDPDAFAKMLRQRRVDALERAWLETRDSPARLRL